MTLDTFVYDSGYGQRERQRENQRERERERKGNKGIEYRRYFNCMVFNRDVCHTYLERVGRNEWRNERVGRNELDVRR